MEAFAWVIVVQIWSNLGFTMVIFLAGLQTIPEEVYESARIDGASRWQAFKNVTWPLLTPAVNTNLVLTIIGSLQAWQLFLVLIGYRPGTQVMGYVVYAEAFGQTTGSTTVNAFRQGYGAAAAMMLTPRDYLTTRARQARVRESFALLVLTHLLLGLCLTIAFYERFPTDSIELAAGVVTVVALSGTVGVLAAVLLSVVLHVGGHVEMPIVIGEGGLGAEVIPIRRLALHVVVEA